MVVVLPNANQYSPSSFFFGFHLGVTTGANRRWLGVGNVAILQGWVSGKPSVSDPTGKYDKCQDSKEDSNTLHRIVPGPLTQMVLNVPRCLAGRLGVFYFRMSGNKPRKPLSTTAMKTKAMNKTILISSLRLFGVSGLFALVPVFMPFSWMAAIHDWLGLGEMPTAPIVEYLARCLSAFYAFYGTLCLLAASDLDRYRPLVRLLALALLLMGIVFSWVDVVSGMPWWWLAIEGPPAIGVGALLLFLARLGQQGETP